MKAEEDVSVDTTDLNKVDSIATDTEELVLHHDECSQTNLFETLLLSTPVCLLPSISFFLRFRAHSLMKFMISLKIHVKF